MKLLKVMVLLIGVTVSISFGAYNIGDTVTDFTLNDCSGIPVNLYDYYWGTNGGTQYVVLINFAEPW